jgi:hypothetical protein
LPTLVALLVLALGFWRGEVWTRPIRAALAARLARAVEGPPIPHSDRPQVVGGSIVRRALLLRDDVPASSRPGGPPTETIRHRMFVDIYDVWPLKGEPTHLRVGNRRPIGWVSASDLLPWDTRLVVRGAGGSLPLVYRPESDASKPTQVGGASFPVLGWSGEAIRVAIWVSERPWSEVDRLAWIRQGSVPAGDWGLWLARDELLALLRRTISAEAESPEKLRLRALVGRLFDDRAMTDEDLKAARTILPPPAFAISAGTPVEASERLARINERWSAETSWGGLSFRFIPLEALP